MKIFFILFYFSTIQQTYAATLLIPDSTVSVENYNKKCQIDGYLCTQKYFLNQEFQKPAPLFNALIDSIDLSDKSFVNNLTKNVQTILKTEMISTEQLEMLIRLLDQVEEINKESKVIKQIALELKYILSSIPPEKDIDLMQGKFIVFFKKHISIDSFKKIKKSYLNIPYQEIRFNQFPLVSSNQNESLVSGFCESAKVSANIENIQWQILSEKSCSWTESFGKSTTGITTTIKEHKGWLITGALILGVAILTSQYDVKLQF
ncbi:MAG: hypothetical protein WA160_11465 [Pseudobdellovibrio sp.]